MVERINRNCSIRAFASFTYFEEGDPANSAVFAFEDDAGRTVILATTRTVAAEMQSLLSHAFAQMEKASKPVRTQVTPDGTQN
jgi:hypothetical protein